MSRISFYMYKETSTGKMVLDRDVNTDQLNFFRDGFLVPFPQTVNNGDGTYYFTPSGSGNYSAYLNNKPQDEFYNIYIPDSDALDETRVDGTSITIFNNKLALYNSASVLFEGSLINDLTSHADSASLTALQGNVLNGYIANKLNANDVFLKEANIVQDFTSSLLANQVQSAESLKIDFSNTDYISEETNYVGALRRLDTAFLSESTGSGYRHYYFFGDSGSLKVDTDFDERWMKTIDSAMVNGEFGGGGYYMAKAGVISRMTVQYTVFTSSATSTYTALVKNAVMNGGSTTTGILINISGSATGSRGDTFDFSDAIEAGNWLGTSIEISDASDITELGEWAIIVEITY